MITLNLLLILLGLIFVAFGAFGVPSRWNISWPWLGVLLLAVALLVVK